MFIIISLACIFSISLSRAADFNPPVITLIGKDTLYPAKDGTTVPFTLDGSGATVWLVIYSYGADSNQPLTTNGFMGWHTFQGVDTLLYVSPGQRFEKGAHEITWNGNDKNGQPFASSQCTYYLIALDQTTRITAAPVSGNWIDGMQIIKYAVDGSLLAKPLFYESRYNGSTVRRFALGSDPTSTPGIFCSRSEH